MKLEDLKPGDQVIYRYTSRYAHDEIAVVERRTKTQLIVKGNRFRVSDGYEIKKRGPWDCVYKIIPAAPDQIAEVKHQQQIRRDQRRAYDIAQKLSAAVRDSTAAAAAIPHLEAALAALDSSTPKQ